MNLSHIHKIYHNKDVDTEVFHDLNFHLEYEGLILLYGMSGSGKTTLFQIMTGLDKDYRGDIIIEEKLEYITQEITLIENLSVRQNLTVTCPHHKQMNEYMEYFQLSQLSDKKIKYLSNGEKRRVQIIRSLLNQPQVLLCDEPTASLDYDNAKLVCEMLKEVSKQITVIITSHDYPLLSEYADTILHLSNRRLSIEKAGKKVQNQALINEEQHLPHKTIKDYLKASVLLHKAHLSTMLCNLLFICCILISVYSIYYYVGMNYEAMRKENWIYSRNEVQLIPHTKVYDKFYDQTKYEYSDIVTKQEILDAALTKQTDIVAYAIQWDAHFHWLYGNEYYNNDAELTKTIYQNVPLVPYTSFLFLTDLETSNWQLSDSDTWVRGYQLLQQDGLPLSEGTYPQKDHEAVIGAELADYLCEKRIFSDRKALIGKTLNLELGQAEAHIPELANVTYPVKITGITAFSNKYERRVFFADSVLGKAFAQQYKYREDKMIYNEARFLLQPDTDPEEFSNFMNEKIDLKYGSFQAFDLNKELLNENLQSSEVNKHLVIFISCLVIASSLFGIVYMSFYYRKQYKKELNILHRYGYRLYFYDSLSNFITISIAVIACLLILPYLIAGINIAGEQLLHRELLSYDSEVFNICLLSVSVCYILFMNAIAFLYRKKR